MQARTVELNRVEREQLQAVVRRATSPVRDVFRARIVLDAAAGLSNEAIAAARKTRPATVSKWRGRFLAARLAGLGDAPRSGKPARYNQATERRVLHQLEVPAPAGYARWNGTLLAAALPDISADQIWRVAQARYQPGTAAQLVCQYRSVFCPEGRRCGGALPEPSGECHRAVGGRETAHPGPGARPGLAAPA